MIHSIALFSKVNKDPVYQTDLHFLKSSNSFEKDFEIQFTPPLVFQPKQFLTALKALSLDTIKRVHVNLEKSSTITKSY